MSFADKLRAAMERVGVSQSELARRLGVRSQAVNQWLAPGGTVPRGARLHKVAAVLNIGLSELLAETKPDSPAERTRTELLAAYDAMDEEQRRALLMVANVMVPWEKMPNADPPPASDPSTVPKQPLRGLRRAGHGA